MVVKLTFESTFTPLSSNAHSSGNKSLCKRVFQATALKTLAIPSSYARFYAHFQALHRKCVAIKRMLQIQPNHTLANQRLVVMHG